MRATKYIITSPECTDILPSDISALVYESRSGIRVKETCFGAIIEGEEQQVESLAKEIRALDPSGIFIKDRGFALGDSNHCRGSIIDPSCRIISSVSGRRSGSARPGCYMIEAESKLLPMISKALASLAEKDH